MGFQLRWPKVAIKSYWNLDKVIWRNNWRAIKFTNVILILWAVLWLALESAGFWIHTSWSSGAFLCGACMFSLYFCGFVNVSVWLSFSLTLAWRAQHIKCCVKPSSVKWILKSSNTNAYLLTSLREGAAPGLFLVWRKQSLPKLSFLLFQWKRNGFNGNFVHDFLHLYI